MRTRQIYKKRLAAMFSTMAIVGAAFAGPADAGISHSVDIALPDNAKNKGFVLKVGDRTIESPRLENAALNATFSADETLPFPNLVLDPILMDCPDGSTGLAEISAMDVAGGAEAFVSATVTGDTTKDGLAFSETTGPIGASPNGSGGATLPAVTLCVY